MKTLGLHSESFHCPLAEALSSSYQKMFQAQWLIVKARQTAASNLYLESGQPVLSIFVNMEASSPGWPKSWPCFCRPVSLRPYTARLWQGTGRLTCEPCPLRAALGRLLNRLIEQLTSGEQLKLNSPCSQSTHLGRLPLVVPVSSRAPTVPSLCSAHHHSILQSMFQDTWGHGVSANQHCQKSEECPFFLLPALTIPLASDYREI